MECNRDEAERAKEIAEKKFLAKDVAGAKKFAIKALSLYPHIDGISQLLATLDVFIYADNKINGEVDWYGVLGVNPLDNEDAIRKKYRKLVLMLHPDKNKANGANGAFLLVSQAWDLLSDKTKRSAYDKITSLHRFQHKVQPQCRGSATPAAAQNGFHNSTEGSDIKVPKDNKSSVHGDFHKQKTASTDSPKPSNVPPPFKNEQSAVPPSSYKQKPANASVPPPHKYRPNTVPASSHKHNGRTAPPDPSHKEKSSTFSPSHKHKRSTMPGSSHEQKPPRTVPFASHNRNWVPDPPRKPEHTESFLSACHECKKQYYCPMIYINQDLLCRECFNEVFHGRKPR